MKQENGVTHRPARSLSTTTMY